MSNGHECNGDNPAFYFVQLGPTLLVCDRPWLVRVAPTQPGRAGACEAHVTIAPRRSSTPTGTTMEAARTQPQVGVRAQAQRGEDGVEFTNA